MSITIKRTNGTTLVEVADQTINTTEVGVALVGRGAVQYAQAFSENFVKLLENFASATAPARPMVGQCWFHTTEKTLKVWDGSDWVAASGGGGATGNTSQLPGDKLAGWTGVGIDTGNATLGTVTVAVTIANGKIVAIASSVNVPANVLPATITIDKKQYDLASRFTAGLSAGITMSTDSAGYVFAGTATSANYADLAERYETSEAVEAGDVVEIGGEKEIQKVRGAASVEVFGVISTAPGSMLNSNAGTDETHPYVALAGRVPCKVFGPVRKGQRLVSSALPGVAVAAVGNEPLQAVLGRALADKTDSEVGLVEVVLGGVK